MNFLDMIKNSVLERFDGTLSVWQVVLGLMFSLAAGVFILYVYRRTMRKVAVSRSFMLSLMLICVITAMMVLTITSNLALSLGMVGALSIVRFRTAVKEPTDTAFLFWAIATGIICGAGYVTISILMTLLLGLLFVAVHAFAGKQKHGTYMIVVRCDADSEVESKLAALSGYKMRNKTMTGSYTELVAELKLTDAQLKKIDFLRNIPGVREFTIMNSVSGSVL